MLVASVLFPFTRVASVSPVNTKTAKKGITRYPMCSALHPSSLHYNELWTIR